MNGKLCSLVISINLYRPLAVMYGHCCLLCRHTHQNKLAPENAKTGPLAMRNNNKKTRMALVLPVLCRLEYICSQYKKIFFQFMKMLSHVSQARLRSKQSCCTHCKLGTLSIIMQSTGKSRPAFFRHHGTHAHLC